MCKILCCLSAMHKIMILKLLFDAQESVELLNKKLYILKCMITLVIQFITTFTSVKTSCVYKLVQSFCPPLHRHIRILNIQNMHLSVVSRCLSTCVYNRFKAC